MPERVEQLNRWLLQELKLPPYELTPASADASFRRYFRLTFDDETRIVMDAPPDKEDVDPFVRIGKQLHAIGLNVPQIYEENLQEGFLLLSDLGNTPYLNVLNKESADRLYGDAMEALVILQACGPGAQELPRYDRELLLREMELFREWYLGKHLGIELSHTESRMLDDTFEFLIDAALAQPQAAVHRDYHSRNLMLTEHNPGIIDFQDAVFGPVTYDLLSLFRDAYIEWPQQRVEEWVLNYHDVALDSGILREPGKEAFLRDFDLMGAQRHLKVLGIFARLYHRDGKDGYLKDMPLTLKYLKREAERQKPLQPLWTFLIERVEPALAD